MGTSHTSPSGPPAGDAGGPAATFVEALDARAEISPAATMLIDERGSITFAGFRERARQVAAGLAELGVGSGTPVSWQLPNAIDTLVLFTALAMLDARQSPLLMGFRQRELRQFFEMTRPELVVTAGRWRGTDHTELAEAALATLGRPVRVIDALDALPGTGAGVVPTIDPDSPHFVYATSGSSGTPKLVQHTDRSLLAWAIAQAGVQGVGPDDVNAAVSPLAHIGGGLVLGQCLGTGCAGLLLDGYDPDATPELMSRHGTTIITTVPTVLMSLVDVQRAVPRRLFPKLRFCVGGAAPKPPTLHGDIRRHLGGRGLLMAYGMTEAGSIGVPSPDDTDEQLESTVGAPLPGLSVRIVDDAGADLVVGSVGEIRVKGPSVMPGYVDPALDREAFDAEGYLCTGDLGRLRPDGHLEVVGRLKDIIIRKGENISPKEIEDLLFGMDDVADVAVIGVPDPLAGERVCAAIVPRAGAAVTLDRIVDHCRRGGLMLQKIPQQLEVMESLPRTTMGKVDKRSLRGWLSAPKRPENDAD